MVPSQNLVSHQRNHTDIAPLLMSMQQFYPADEETEMDMSLQRDISNMLLEVPRLLASEEDQGEYRHLVASKKDYDETRLGHMKIREFLKSRGQRMRRTRLS